MSEQLYVILCSLSFLSFTIYAAYRFAKDHDDHN